MNPSLPKSYTAIKEIANSILSHKDSIILNLKNSLFYFGGSLIQFLIAIFTMPLFAQNLSASDFAVLGYFAAVNSFFTPLFHLNLQSYYLSNYYRKKGGSSGEDLSFGLNFLNISNIPAGLIALVIVYLYFKLLDVQFPLLPYIFIIVLHLFLDKFRMFYLIFCRIQKKGLSFLTISALSAIFNAVFSILFVINLKLGAHGKFAGPLFGSLLVAVVVIIILVRMGSLKFSFSLDKNKIKDSMKFVWPLILAEYTTFPIANIDIIYLERLNAPEQFGLYSIGLAVSSFVMAFFYVFYQAFEPDMYRFLQHGKPKKYYLFWVAYLLFQIVIVIMFFLFSRIILSLLTSARYVDASDFANFFLIGLVIMNLGGFFTQIFKAFQLTKLVFIHNLIIAILSLVVYYLMIRWDGFDGALVARIMVGFFFILTGLILYQVYRKKIIHASQNISD